MLTLAVAVIGALARVVLVTLHLGQGIPPQVLGLVCCIEDGVRQAVVAVQVRRSAGRVRSRDTARVSRPPHC